MTAKICPKCGAASVVTKDSRPSIDPNVLVRRVCRCTICDHRFTTHEIIVSEEGGGTTTQAVRAKMFVEAVDELARTHFGVNGEWQSAVRTGLSLGRNKKARP